MPVCIMLRNFQSHHRASNAWKSCTEHGKRKLLVFHLAHEATTLDHSDHSCQKIPIRPPCIKNNYLNTFRFIDSLTDSKIHRKNTAQNNWPDLHLIDHFRQCINGIAHLHQFHYILRCLRDLYHQTSVNQGDKLERKKNSLR